ncbi:MAG: hypothetical protein ACK5JG_19460, partial [Pseudomonadota bacterium]
MCHPPRGLAAVALVEAPAQLELERGHVQPAFVPAARARVGQGDAARPRGVGSGGAHVDAPAERGARRTGPQRRPVQCVGARAQRRQRPGVERPDARLEVELRRRGAVARPPAQRGDDVQRRQRAARPRPRGPGRAGAAGGRRGG